MCVIFILNIEGTLNRDKKHLASSSFESFNFQLISFDICKTVGSIIYANLLHCSNAPKNAFGLRKE